MSIHEGHRQRLRTRFLQEGLDQFNQIQALELLLFYCVPRKDTNPLAHALLEYFGSFNAVLDATPKELMKVEGVGENIAMFLSLMKETWRYYNVQSAQTNKSLTTVEQCGDYLLPYFVNRDVETVFLLCLDAKCKVICCRLIGEGSVNSASISVRKIVETALNVNATSVVLAHNHPSGVAIPSLEDIQTTKCVARALHAVEIVLVDHIVVAENDYVSISMSGGYSIGENQNT